VDEGEWASGLLAGEYSIEREGFLPPSPLSSRSCSPARSFYTGSEYVRTTYVVGEPPPHTRAHSSSSTSVGLSPLWLLRVERRRRPHWAVAATAAASTTASGELTKPISSSSRPLSPAILARAPVP